MSRVPGGCAGRQWNPGVNSNVCDLHFCRNYFPDQITIEGLEQIRIIRSGMNRGRPYTEGNEPDDDSSNGSIS